MMRRSIPLLSIGAILLLLPLQNNAITIGSASSVQRQGFITFPSGDNNEIDGFVVLEEGFALQDAQTTCTFNGEFPVMTKIELNGGTLELKRDLTLGNVTTFTSFGDVTANSCKFELPASMDTLGSGANEVFTFKNVELILNSNITLNACVQFAGNSVIDGRGHVLDLSSTASLIVCDNTQLVLKNVRLEGINTTKVHCVDGTGVLKLQDMMWMQDGDFQFAQGAMLFMNHVDLIGSAVFAYQSQQVSTIMSGAHVECEFGMTFSYDPSSQAKNLLACADSTSVLALDGSTLYAGLGGMQLSGGKLLIKNNATITSEVQEIIQGNGETIVTDEGITFGTSSAGADCALIILNDMTLTCPQGTVNYKNVDAASCQMGNTYSTLHMASDTRLNVYELLNVRPGKISFGNNAILAYAPGKKVRGSVCPLGKLYRAYIPSA